MRLNSPKINLITKACMKASRHLIRDFGEIENLQVSSKAPGDFVTSADKRTEKIILDELHKANSDFGIVTEESGLINKSNNENRWIVDPIDGTMNFLNGVPHFAISIGYEEKGEVVCGVIFNPITNEMYYAEKGNGAYVNSSRIRVSRKKKIKDQLLNLGLKVHMHEPKTNIKKETDIYLVNSFGKTKSFYSMVNNVFLGGSLINHGGQNPLEAVRYNCNTCSRHRRDDRYD